MTAMKLKLVTNEEFMRYQTLLNRHLVSASQECNWWELSVTWRLRVIARLPCEGDSAQVSHYLPRVIGLRAFCVTRNVLAVCSRWSRLVFRNSLNPNVNA
jgi:hypothetical protein